MTTHSVPTMWRGSAKSEGRSDEVQFFLPKYTNREGIRLEIDGSRLAPIYQILLHGSQATNDTCDFSDVDVLVILDDSRPFTASEHRTAISELRALLKSIFLYDCLMHHGLMFLRRSLLEDYEEAFLPVETLQNAMVLHGPLRVRLRRAVPHLSLIKKRLRASAKSLNNRLERNDHTRNDYSFKSLLSGLLLMPSLLLESVNVFCYKKESFSLGPRQFADINWSVITWAEELRLRWKRPPTPFLQNVVSKVAHPHTIIRLSRTYPPRMNVELFLGDQADAFKTGCQEFLHCVTAL